MHNYYTTKAPERDGRIAGYSLSIGPLRRDGKHLCTLHYATAGRTLRKLWTPERVATEVAKMLVDIAEYKAYHAS